MIARIDVGRQRHLLHVHGEDLLAAVDVGARNDDLAVEAARAQKRRIEHVRTVGRGDDDDAFVRLEAVHLDQQLVERLLALVIAVAEAGAAMAADRVDFVDEDDARRRLLGLVEHVADAACADADEHFDEVRTGDGEEGNARLTRDGAGEKRLAGAGRADQQRALRDLAAEAREAARILEELDDFLKLFAGLVDAGDVGEGHAALLFGQHAGAALAEAHRAGAGVLLHLAHHEEADAEDQQEGQRLVEEDQPEARLLGFLGLHLHALLDQAVGDLRVGGSRRAESLAVRQLAGDDLVAAGGRGGRDGLDVLLVHLLARIRNRG